ncbi:hypothetical protein GCM10010495_50700 [Kitasatospora herbaricolor]|nr:hypothetical protein GCM10010495_50700 [Kitasatospora herbaricolor]
MVFLLPAGWPSAVPLGSPVPPGGFPPVRRSAGRTPVLRSMGQQGGRTPGSVTLGHGADTRTDGPYPCDHRPRAGGRRRPGRSAEAACPWCGRIVILKFRSDRLTWHRHHFYGRPTGGRELRRLPAPGTAPPYSAALRFR